MRPDVIVVGGGLMGCSVAYWLAKRGTQVWLLEKSVPGAEASSAAAGILSPSIESYDDPLALRLGRRSRELHATLAAELHDLLGIDIGFRRCGVIHIARDRDEVATVERQAAKLAQSGVACEVWSRDDVRREEPACHPDVESAIHVAEDAQVEPKKLLSAVALAAERSGVVFHTGATVREIVTEGGRVRGIRTDSDLVETDRVVVAAGSWTTLVPGIDLDPQTIYPVRGQILATRTRPPLFRRIVFGAGGYVVTRPDGRVLCGSTEERVGFARGTTLGGMAGVIETALQIAPSLEGALVEDHWSSFRPGTPDGLPLVGETQVDGLMLASGHFRNGILLAPLTAEIIADALLDANLPADAKALSPTRFQGSTTR